MKPSERIYNIKKELFNHYSGNNDIDELQKEIKAIKKYLDEEYEKGACSRGEHEHEDEVWNDMYICKNCRIIHS